MPLSEYYRIVRQHGWIIVLVAVLGAASALLFSMAQRPTYQSIIRLNVIGARPDFGLSQTVKGLLRNYAGQIRSHDTAASALRDMPEPLDLTPEALLAKINVQAVESDLQLVIQAEDQDPHIAEMIAQQMANTFVWTIEQFNLKLDQRDRVNVFTSGPASPAVKVRPQKKINTLAGGILGAVAGLGLVLLLEWMDSRFVRRPGELPRGYGLALLGTVDSDGRSQGSSLLSAGGIGASASELAGRWAIPLVGGLALGIVLSTVFYLVF